MTCARPGCRRKVPPKHWRWCSRRCARQMEPPRPREPCQDCGGPKDPGVGRRYCAECRAKRQRTYCRTCGAALPDRMRRTCDSCQEAVRERKRAHNRAWNLAHRDVLAAAQRRYEAANPERVYERKRRHRERVKADPQRYARYLETQRMGRRLRAERDGRPMRPVPEERYPAASTKWTTEGDPMRELVADALTNGWQLGELADAAGVSPRLLYRLLHENGKVSVAAADRIVVALGLHLHLVYEAEAV